MSTAVFGAPEFRARNGLIVKPCGNGGVDVGKPGYRDYTPPEATFALEEFFQAKRDAELGRWRWPESPEWIVYPRRPGFAPLGDADLLVINEVHGASMEYVAADDDGTEYVGPDERAARAARAYFEAHPERPAAEAKAGEVWELTIDDGSEHTVFIHADRTTGGRDGVSAGGAYFDLDDGSNITAARKLWSEDAS